MRKVVEEPNYDPDDAQDVDPMAIPPKPTLPKDVDWNQQPNEPMCWYARFHVFLISGPARTINYAHTTFKLKYSKAPNPSIKDWQKVAKEWKWNQRCERYDQHVIEGDRIVAQQWQTKILSSIQAFCEKEVATIHEMQKVGITKTVQRKRWDDEKKQQVYSDELIPDGWFQRDLPRMALDVVKTVTTISPQMKRAVSGGGSGTSESAPASATTPTGDAQWLREAAKEAATETGMDEPEKEEKEVGDGPS